jgi:hypothetical protein
MKANITVAMADDKFAIMKINDRMWPKARRAAGTVGIKGE